eukprot:TRINITY_DN14679_c0_g3_i3.p1 TRINITY_DN14679_c0_g3~~TRINITY_DN14679_c0_g3_i3.p1  ORF type:complete len:435 (+),score=96.57 TRINITY_DN14679_c0_g3_i3:323-1627(+)
MKYKRLVAIIWLLGVVSGLGSFNSVRVVLAETKMVEIAEAAVKAGLEMMRRADIKPKEEEQNVVFLNFTTTTNLASKLEVVENQLKGSSRVENGVFTVTYLDPFKLNFAFSSSVRTENTFITKGEGTAIAKGNKITLSCNYSALVPKMTATIQTTLDSITFNAGLFTDGVIAVIRKQFENFLKNLTTSIETFLNSIDPLASIEILKQPLKDGRLISVGRVGVEGKSEGKSETRLVTSKMVLGVNEARVEGKCDYSRVVGEGKTEVCICGHLFGEMLVMRSVPKPLNLSKWYLKGRVMELYDILPELINHYSPDAKFTVKESESEAKEGSDHSVTYLTKTYVFKIGDDLVLELKTKFMLTLAGELKQNEFFVRQKNIIIDTLTTNVLVHPSGKTALARLMIYEVNSMKDKYMFSKGMPISHLPQGADDNSFCFAV